MEQYDIIIIGAGLGGLECAYTLSRAGEKVLVLEQGRVAGGCLQSFRRGSALFDTGFHYIGGLDQGRPLERLFEYYNLMELPWVRLDEEFDQVVIGDKRYAFAQGHENFVERLAQQFPHQRENLKRYTQFLKSVGDHLFGALTGENAAIDSNQSLFAQSAYNYLNETISDPELRKVLSGTSLKMQLDAETLPLYVFAQINNSFIEGAYRIKGGGQQIADKLVAEIEANGGKVRCHTKVAALIEEEGEIKAVETEKGERFGTRWVISNAHPAATLNLLKESKAIRKIYRNRINNMRNSYGAFTANIRLKPDSLKYRNSNLFVHDRDTDLWNPKPDGRVHQALVSWGVPADWEAGKESHSNVIDIITPMRWEEVAEWKDTEIGKRPDEYREMKQAKAEEVVEFVSREIPGLRESIDTIYTSTPLSYRDYTSTAEGSAYGVMKNWQSPMTTVLTPKTPVRNLLLTGQNLNLHGILGVTMTAQFTCAEIIGIEKIKKELKL